MDIIKLQKKKKQSFKKLLHKNKITRKQYNLLIKNEQLWAKQEKKSRKRKAGVINYTDEEKIIRDEIIIDDIELFTDLINGPPIVEELKNNLIGILYDFRSNGGNDLVEDLKTNKELNHNIDILESFKARARHTNNKGTRGHHSKIFKLSHKKYRELKNTGVYQLVEYLNELFGKMPVKKTNHLLPINF